MILPAKRNLLIGAGFLAAIAALAFIAGALYRAAAQSTVQAPKFEVDPMWPKPLPNHLLLGNTIGVGVDSRDHVYIIHRGATLEAKEVYATENPPASECCSNWYCRTRRLVPSAVWAHHEWPSSGAYASA